jgi:F-type H+-transporting ATPase subunit b
MLFVCMFTWLFPASALAADPGWRPTYDIAMRWVNFIILAGVIIKYARVPIKNFFKQQKEDVVAKIDVLEAEKNRILEEISAAKKQGVESRERFQELKDRLVAQGETHKQQTIQQAKQQSAIMLEETRRKMQNRIAQAKAGLKMELLDMAMHQAVEKLPALISEGDNQRLLGDYMRSLKT